MKHYLEHIRTKEPHERRRHALQVSGIITGIFFIAWLATLSTRLGSATEQFSHDADSAQAAAAASALPPDAAQLQVSDTSVYSN